MNQNNYFSKNKLILDNIFQIEEFYCLEDNFNIFNIFNNPNIINKINTENYIAVVFYVNGKEKQIIREINELKKYFLFIKIYYEKKYINLLLNTKKNYSIKDLLDNINNIKYLRAPIKINLKIDEFPLTNYILEENQINKEKNIDAIYTLQKSFNINSKKSNNYLNSNNFNNVNNNFNNNIKDDKIKDLERLLNEEKIKTIKLKELLKQEEDKNMKLNLTINELKKIITNLEESLKNKKEELKNISDKLNNNLINSDKKELYEKINKNNIEIKELKEKLSRYPFELLEGEKMLSIIFNSTKQDINFSIICKNTDLFVNIELELYKEYPQYTDDNNFFTVHGYTIKKYKSLDYNKIKNNDIILLNSIE